MLGQAVFVLVLVKFRWAITALKADAVRLIIETESDDGKGNYRACCQELAVE